MTQPSPALTVELAAQLAQIALSGITSEYPTSPGHVLLDASDLRHPRELHPAFYGCFDWHSAVHSHWLLVRLLRVLPGLPEAAPIRRALNDHLTEAHLGTEAAYFSQPSRRSFERPYGWAWLLKLAEELLDWDDPDGRRWSASAAATMWASIGWAASHCICSPVRPRGYKNTTALSDVMRTLMRRLCCNRSLGPLSTQAVKERINCFG